MGDSDPSKRGHGLSAKGGKAIGRRVPLPRGAEPPFGVYINGTEQREGEDYVIRGGEIVFNEPIMKEDLRGLSTIRKLALGLGVIGTYQKHETVDVEYWIDGKLQFASNLKPIPDEDDRDGA